MPPKPKYTREELAAAALRIIKEGGLSALTARELGRSLGTSASPIFTVFKSMDEVKLAARELALKEFMESISDYREYTPAFKRIGMMVVSYGMNEPELFKLLFMQAHRESGGFQSTLQDLGAIPHICTELICQDYGTTPEQAFLVFEQMWTLVYGLGTMCAMGVCSLSEAEIGRRLGLQFGSLLMFMKSGKMDELYSDVARIPELSKQSKPMFDLHSDL